MRFQYLSPIYCCRLQVLSISLSSLCVEPLLFEPVATAGMYLPTNKSTLPFFGGRYNYFPLKMCDSGGLMSTLDS